MSVTGIPCRRARRHRPPEAPACLLPVSAVAAAAVCLLLVSATKAEYLLPVSTAVSRHCCCCCCCYSRRHRVFASACDAKGMAPLVQHRHRPVLESRRPHAAAVHRGGLGGAPFALCLGGGIALCKGALRRPAHASPRLLSGAPLIVCDEAKSPRASGRHQIRVGVVLFPGVFVGGDLF